MRKIKACHLSLISLLSIICCASQAWSAPDSFTESKLLFDGDRPTLAVDYQSNTVHLVYRNNKILTYRKGDLNGEFGAEEKFSGSSDWFDPRITLDANGNPHVVACTGEAYPTTTQYFNRIGGKWSKGLKVLPLNGAPAVARAAGPTITVDEDGTVFVSAFTSYEGWACSLAKVVNKAGTSSVEKAISTGQYDGMISVFLHQKKLYTFGGMGPNEIKQFDKVTLAPIGSSVKVNSTAAETPKASTDHLGEVHLSGTNLVAGTPLNKCGWYNTFSRVLAKKPDINFSTTNRHASGGTHCVRDRVADSRVYVMHWSGGTVDARGDIKGCSDGKQIKFARIENSVLAADEKVVTTRKASHGTSYRSTPGAAAHPGGGVIVVFTECTSPMKLYWTVVGDSKPTSIHIAKNKVSPTEHLKFSKGMYSFTVNGKLSKFFP